MPLMNIMPVCLLYTSSRMKDFFDCYQLLTKRDLSDDTLYDAIKAVSYTHLTVIRSNFSPEFNPMEEYLKSLPKWDRNTDYIAELAHRGAPSKPPC